MRVFNLPCRHRLILLVSMPVLLAGCAATMEHHDGMFAMEQKNYADAVSHLARAVEMRPDDLEYRRDWLQAREGATSKLLAAAAAAIAAQNYDEAKAAYQSMLKYDRDNARAQAGLEALGRVARAHQDVAQAQEAIRQGDTTLALEWVGRALKNAPGLEDALAIKRDLDAQQARDMIQVPTLGMVYKKPINLEFREASIKMVFDALSRTTGINFIFDRDVKADQRTTVFLKQTTLDDAIDVILSTSQLEKKILNTSSVLIYPNTSAKSKEYQDLMVKAFYLANVEAKQTASMLKSVLKLKEVYVDEKSNMLMLRETPDTIALVEKMIALQDLDEPEVMLDIEVLEINRSRLLNLGVQWSSQFTVSPLNGTPTTSSGGGGAGSTASGSTISLRELKGLNLSTLGITSPTATINVQKTDGDANLLANPRIRVRDREKAKFLIGDKVPVVTTTSTTTFVTENIQYLDVGLKLEVEPEIHLRDEIGLKLSLEVSSLVSSVKTNNGSLAYQIGTRNITSALRLKDGETQVFGGLISDEDRAAANRIPLIGELPVLGRLFGSQSDSRQKTEVLMSITPHLIRNIRRKEPASESFWSGTEASLHNRPLQLRNFDAMVGAQSVVGASATAQPVVATASGAAAGAASPAPSPPVAGTRELIKLNWEGPQSAKVGELVTLALNLDSPSNLRAASLQLAYNPAELEVQSVSDGGYFGKGGTGNFSPTIDKAGGRISIGSTTGDANGIMGAGRLVTVTAKVIAVPATGSTSLSIISLTPIGALRALKRPALPVAHQLNIGR